MEGLRLLALVVVFLVVTTLFRLVLRIPLSLVWGSLWAVAYCAIFTWCGRRSGAGFPRGLLIGVIGTLPGIAVLVSSLISLANSGMEGLRPLWAMTPWAWPLFAFMNALPPSALRLVVRWLPHASVPLAILLTGLGAWWGRRVSSRDSA